MTVLDTFVAGWMPHRKALLELLDCIGEDQLNYKPWEKAMTFSELALHITGSTLFFIGIVKGEERDPNVEAPKARSLAELKQLAQEQTELTKSQLESITAEQLDQIVEFAGMKLPGSALLQLAKDHEVHHKGQLFTYARTAGVENVPFFFKRS
ncbi:DinB family protein [Marinicrinis lubricantis]|uniref:DinB family protein n=1 Tax=Marinicrinis lubricantis TaxID=2086470 RepID=A0ABW1IU90_9BACL